MNLQLPADLEQFVQEQLASGRYNSREQILIEAVRILRNVEQSLPSAQEDLRRELRLGLKDIEDGRVADWDVEKTRQRLLEKLVGRKAV